MIEHIECSTTAFSLDDVLSKIVDHWVAKTHNAQDLQFNQQVEEGVEVESSPQIRKENIPTRGQARRDLKPIRANYQNHNISITMLRHLLQLHIQPNR